MLAGFSFFSAMTYMRRWIHVMVLGYSACMAHPIYRTDPMPRNDSTYLRNLLSRPEFLPFQRILQAPDQHRLQILVTEFQRDGRTLKPILHSYRLREQEYFYPASLVKLPVALLALEKVQKIGIPGINLDTSYRLEPGDCQQEDLGPSTVRRDILAMFAVSENEAFDRLYSFLGQDSIVAGLRMRGYKTGQVTHRLAAKCSMEENRHYNGVDFESPEGETLLRQEPRVTTEHYTNHLEGMDIVHGYDGTERSFLSIPELHRLTTAAVLPELLPSSATFALNDESRTLLLKAMSTMPEDTDLDFDEQDHQGCTSKYLVMGGSRERLPKKFSIFNKVGKALGFLTDSALLIDRESKRTLLVTVTLYVNYARSANDEDHHYKDLGLPFLATLGQQLLRSQNERQDQPLEVEEFFNLYQR